MPMCKALARSKATAWKWCLTLGTGAGTAIFRDGEIMPHLELAHHPVSGGKTYDEYIGNAAREKKGKKAWSKRVAKVIEILRVVVRFDHLYLGGGNAKDITFRAAAGRHDRPQYRRSDWRYQALARAPCRPARRIKPRRLRLNARSIRRRMSPGAPALCRLALLAGVGACRLRPVSARRRAAARPRGRRDDIAECPCPAFCALALPAVFARGRCADRAA